MRKIIDKLFSRICLDERIKDGVFFMEDENHMDVLQEYLEKYGVDKKHAMEIRYKMLEGKFPERQAYNKDCLLVTFPTPEYKKRAIDRGTHFEQDPTKKAPNVTFDTNQPQPATPPTPTTEKPVTTPRETPSQLTPADTTTPSPAPAPVPEQPATPVDTTPTVSAPPLPTPITVAPPTPIPTQPQQQIPPTSEPVNPAKTKEEKKAAEEYTEKILKY